MRGKNILWLSLVAILIGVSIMPITIAPASDTKIYVDPPTLSGLQIGDVFTVDIKISRSEDVYSYGFVLDYADYMVTLALLSVEEGEYLHGGPYPWPYQTYFYKTIDHFGGKVTIGCTRAGDVPGAFGDGTLVTLTFSIVGPGDSPFELLATELWRRGATGLEPIVHNVFSGYYYGPTANLVHKQLTARDMKVGELQEFYCSVKNDADIPLYVKVRFSMVRDDNKIIDLWAGQRYLGGYLGEPRYTELYVNGYDPIIPWQWMGGTAPYLDQKGEGSYVAENTYCNLVYRLQFEDIELGPDDILGTVVAEHYSRADIDFTTPGQVPGDIDADLVLRSVGDGDNYWFYAGALESGPWWAWRTVTNVANMRGHLSTEEKLNNAFGYIHYWIDEDDYMGTPTWPSCGNFTLDALRLRVEFATTDPADAPVYELQPGESLTLDPATWTLKDADIGKYYCTATAYYSADEVNWVRATKEKTFTWWVTEA